MKRKISIINNYRGKSSTEIISEWLIQNKYNGLRFDECTCMLGNLGHCGAIKCGCEPIFIDQEDNHDANEN